MGQQARPRRIDDGGLRNIGQVDQEARRGMLFLVPPG